MTGFTDQKLRIATKEDLIAPWSGYKDGTHFYCYLCGYSFEEGDQWRWIYAGKHHAPNIMVCENCDNGNNELILQAWDKIWEEWEELSHGKFRFIATRLKDAERDAQK